MLSQPTPDEFAVKRAVFERLSDMTMQVQRMRRALGFQWLEGGVDGLETGPLSNIGAARIHAEQSGLLIVAVAAPQQSLRIETQIPSNSRLMRFHDEWRRMSQAEYVWDEAMLAERQS